MKRALLVSVLSLAGMFAALPSFADSIKTVALQDNGFVSIVLNPTHDPLLNPTSVPSHLDFISYFGPIGAVNFSSTLTLAGQNFDFGPFTTTCVSSGGCGVIYGWNVPISYKPIIGVLTVDLNGVKETYDFRFQTPAPEPASILLSGTGLLAILARRTFRRRKTS